MDALVMCGGRGTRLDTEREKPLYPVAGRALVDYVLDALAGSRVDRVYAAVTPHTPTTAAHLTDRDVHVVETPGEGYVADLGVALDTVDTPVLTVAADLPLLDATAVDRVLDVAEREATAVQVCVPAALKRRLGASTDTTYERDGRELAPTGVNVVADTDTDTETMHFSYDARYAVNVNRRTDAELAEALL